jgi:ferritin-like protein
MSATALHENASELASQTRDLHRALTSLQEELEAVDWYRQRADACTDTALKAILLHNMKEEMEHAAMLLEWLRRSNKDFDALLRTFLFSKDDIHELETS